VVATGPLAVIGVGVSDRGRQPWLQAAGRGHRPVVRAPLLQPAAETPTLDPDRRRRRAGFCPI
jgi:hypothetical protein